MRDLTKEYLDKARDAEKRPSIDTVFAINGGKPSMANLNWIESGKMNSSFVEFHGEPGLITPASLFRPPGAKNAQIIVSDDGKAVEIAKRKAASVAQLYVDILGTGELSGIELRYPIYLGRSVPFIGGSTIARAALEMKKYGSVEVVAHGPLATLAALYAGLLDPSLKITATDALRSWQDYLAEGVPPAAVQPRAHLLPTLEELRKQVKGEWKFRDPKPQTLDPVP
jgi:hypothetical protein